MAMTLHEIREFVREHMDIEEEDLPNSVLDVFIRDGSSRIEKDDAWWPFYQAIAEFTLGDDTASLTLTSVAADLDKLVSLRREDGQVLRYVGVQELLRLSTNRTGKPSYYTQWGDTLLFWPKNQTSQGMYALYYRRPVDWIAEGAGGSPDMPDELHEAVATWALARAYAQQEDPEMAALYFQAYEDQLSTFKRTITEMPLDQPVVMNGGGVIRWMDVGPKLDWM